jgi:hypothetical protein
VVAGILALASTGFFAYLGRDVLTKYLYDPWRQAANSVATGCYPDMIKAEMFLRGPLDEALVESYKMIVLIEWRIHTLGTASQTEEATECNASLLQHQHTQFWRSLVYPAINEQRSPLDRFVSRIEHLRKILRELDPITLDLLISRWGWWVRSAWKFDLEDKLSRSFWVKAFEAHLKLDQDSLLATLEPDKGFYRDRYSFILFMLSEFFACLEKWRKAVHRDLRDMGVREPLSKNEG